MYGGLLIIKLHKLLFIIDLGIESKFFNISNLIRDIFVLCNSALILAISITFLNKSIE